MIRDNFSTNPRRYLTDRTKIGTDNECWPWLLSTGSHGYGQGYDGTTVRTAHSMWWEYSTGERPGVETGLTIDHICHNKICCNPSHLRVLPNEVNAADNGNATKTHCPQGHEYTPENTEQWTNPKRPGSNPSRRCRACQASDRAKRARSALLTPCGIAGCHNPANAHRGWCWHHYGLWRRHRHPLGP